MRTLLPMLLLSGCSEFELIKEPVAPTPAPAIRVEPAALSFRSSPLSETQVELVHIHNDGDAALSLDTLWIEGAGLDSFTLDRDLGGTVLLPGEQRDVGVLFTPDRTDPSAMLQIGSDDPGVAVWPVPLAGAGEVGALLLTPNPLDLGYADPGEQTTGTLYVRNVGLDTVTLTETYTEPGPFSVLTPALPLALAPDALVALSVTFAPTGEGAFVGGLWIGSDDETGARKAGLEGRSGEAFREDDDGCYSDDFGYGQYPEAQFTIASTEPITATYDGVGGGYTAELWLLSPDNRWIATGHETAPGTTIDLGSFTPGDQLVLGIKVRDTGDIFYAGPGSWNPDGLPHGAITYLGGCEWKIGFEDLYGGGDRDYDDIRMHLSGPLQMTL